MLDVNSTLVSNGDGLAIHRRQEITDDFLASLKDARTDSVQRAVGEFHRVASVPVAVAEIWLRQGFDIYKAKPREIVARLKQTGLDAFLTTAKAV